MSVGHAVSSAHGRSTLLVWTALSAVYLIWGSTYLAIRFTVETTPPFLSAAARFLVSGVALYIWLGGALYSIEPGCITGRHLSALAAAVRLSPSQRRKARSTGAFRNSHWFLWCCLINRLVRQQHNTEQLRRLGRRGAGVNFLGSGLNLRQDR